MDFFYISWILLLWGVVSVSALYDSCAINSGLIGGSCDKNDDCDGFAVVCVLGKCQCHPNYAERTDQTLNSKYCAKLPDRVDSICTDSCKLPMFCNAGKCECIRSIIIQDICLPDSLIGQSCTKNQECVLPFSACIDGKCQCIAGTTHVDTACRAVRNCPTGAKPAGPCSRNVSSGAVVQNYANSGSYVDNCTTKGDYCYTDDTSGNGICCPAVCPLSQNPDFQFTCDHKSVTPMKILCPDDTHYCHRAIGQSYSSTVCCRRPCLDPTPILIKGTCYPRAFLSGPCQLNEQCDGGYGMECSSSRVCQCKSGFTPYSDNFTNADNNPAQSCVRSCRSDEIPHNGECFKGRIGLQEPCVLSIQCPTGAKCRRGLCLCDCGGGFVPTSSNSACAAVETRTAKPAPVFAGSTQANLIDLLKSILGRNTVG